MKYSSRSSIQNSYFLFALGDGDNIGVKIERLLLEENTESCAKLSDSIKLGINNIANNAIKLPGWAVIFSGGDDILMKIKQDSYSNKLLGSMMSVFQQTTGCTISFGVSRTTSGAILNLRRAKSNGSGLIFHDTLSDLMKKRSLA